MGFVAWQAWLTKEALSLAHATNLIDKKADRCLEVFDVAQMLSSTAKLFSKNYPDGTNEGSGLLKVANETDPRLLIDALLPGCLLLEVAEWKSSAIYANRLADGPQQSCSTLDNASENWSLVSDPVASFGGDVVKAASNLLDASRDVVANCRDVLATSRES